MLVESLNQSSTTDWMSALQQADVLIQASAQVDMDGDGDLDWLLALVRGKNLWALMNMGGIFQPVYLNNVDIPEDIPDQSAFKVDTFQNEKTGDWFVVLSTAQEFNIYQAEQVSTTVNIANVFNDWYVQQYTFQQTARGLELEIDGLYDYQWNAQQRRFEPIPLFKDDLFTDEYLAYSLPYLERIVSNFGESDDPGLLNGKLRFLYFLGLAYERTGESGKAARIYWQIWHDYPETGYARLACSKIENCIP